MRYPNLVRPFVSYIHSVAPPRSSGLMRCIGDHTDLFRAAAGSSHNHQAWPGGLLDHLAHGAYLGSQLYWGVDAGFGPPPFPFESFVVAWLFHDWEKLHTYGHSDGPKPFDKTAFLTETLPAKYKVTLTADELHAIEFAHGEGDRYRKDARVMSRLAALVHAVDTLSARLLFDLRRDDTFRSE